MLFFCSRINEQNVQLTCRSERTDDALRACAHSHRWCICSHKCWRSHKCALPSFLLHKRKTSTCSSLPHGARERPLKHLSSRGKIPNLPVLAYWKLWFAWFWFSFQERLSEMTSDLWNLRNRLQWLQKQARVFLPQTLRQNLTRNAAFAVLICPKEERKRRVLHFFHPVSKNAPIPKL